MNNSKATAEKILNKYTEKQYTDLDALRDLDRKVKRPANTFSYVFGSISAVIMGAGMSLVMTDIGSYVGIENAMLPGIAIGVVGLILALVNYPIHKTIMKSRKSKYGSEIINLSNSIINA